jgi:hypothetical protein
MALNTSPVFPPVGNPPFRINREWCVGDSLAYMNANFENFDNRILSLSSQSIQNLNTFKNQVTPTVLFIPANYATRSNANVILENRYWSRNAVTTGGFPTNRNTAPWWSGVQTTNISKVGAVPVNTIGILAEIEYNVNSRANNAQYLFVRRDPLENWGNTGAGTPTAVPNFGTLNTRFSKTTLDPVYSNGLWEAEHSITIPIYISSAAGFINTFQWFIYDRGTSARTNFPEYSVVIRLYGYYIRVT